MLYVGMETRTAFSDSLIVLMSSTNRSVAPCGAKKPRREQPEAASKTTRVTPNEVRK